ncbi:MAG: hypothetical protein AB7H86_21890 [Blastocatellales bacterium]
MLMADTMTVFFVILGLLLAFPALWLLARGLWPGTIGAARDLFERGLIGSFLAGAPAVLLIVFVTALVGRLGTPGKIGAGALICFAIVYAGCGVSGLATMIGERLRGTDEREGGWRSTLLGGIILTLSWLLPVLGWFVILPISMTVGLGAVLRATGSRIRRRSVAAEAIPVTAEPGGGQ